ncbi:unnamed protein product [Larinioides sclopetarius]|uniref:Uncharacterized protein n=1 Tax=Larinioides sclopetarius TaxID=280406 RepID=A0AAV2BDT6_9ARAC
MAEFRTNFPVEEDKPARKIVFLGDPKVGKTTFIKRYSEYMRDYYRCERFEGTYLAFTQYVLYLNRFDRRVPIRFLDLPSDTSEESRLDQYPNEINVIVLCYAVDDLASFANVWERWIPEFQEYYPDARFYLLGLKCDMRLELLAANRIPVNAERGRVVHQRYRFSGDYLECSVEGNPQHARHCMDILINDAFMYEATLRVE